MAEDYTEDMEIKVGISPTEDFLKEVKNCEERMQILEKKYKQCPAWRSKERKNLEDRMRYEQENMKRIMASVSSGEQIECRSMDRFQ